MHVSGGLFHLPENRLRVPLPWFNRAPLGLESNTAVYAALVESGNGAGGSVGRPNDKNRYRPPDLLISVLNPEEWEQTCLLEASSPDGPGLVHDLLRAIADVNGDGEHINIEIGESFTLPTPDAACRWLRQHKTMLYCQLRQPNSRAVLDTMLSKLREKFPIQYARLSAPLAPRPAGSVAMPLGLRTVLHGLVTLDVDWRNEAREQFRQGLLDDAGLDLSEAAAISDRFDYDMAYASADLEARGIRLTFPFKGARQLESKHGDKPNTIIQVSDKLQPRHSILGGLLAKSDGTSAKFHAICEPVPDEKPLDDDPFPELRHKSGFRKLSVSDALDWRDVLFIKLPVQELVRQIRARLTPFGDRVGGLMQELCDALTLAKVFERPAVRTCAASMVRLSGLHRAGAEAIESLMKAHEIELFSDVGVAGSKKLIRLLRLISADLAVFVLWDNCPGCEAIQHAILHAEFCAGRQSPSAILLVESDTDELPPSVRAIEYLLRRRVEIRTFTWKPEHSEAWHSWVETSGEGNAPSLLLENSCLISRIQDWIYRLDRETGAG